MKNIQDWIETVMDTSDDVWAILKVLSVGSSGWQAKIVDNDGFVLLCSEGETFMIAESGDIEGAIAKLDKMCANDLKKIVALAC